MPRREAGLTTNEYTKLQELLGKAGIKPNGLLHRLKPKEIRRIEAALVGNDTIIITRKRRSLRIFRPETYQTMQEMGRQVAKQNKQRRTRQPKKRAGSRAARESVGRPAISQLPQAAQA